MGRKRKKRKNAVWLREGWERAGVYAKLGD
jgi:hypothetical protein